MAKKTDKRPAPAPQRVEEAAADGSATVTTIHGETIPASELAHIAPHLQPFAVAIGSLKRDPKNARAHDKKSVASKAATLQEFGQQELLQFDPETRIVKVGNGRHEAAEQILEWKWIAAVGSNLSSEKLRAFALAHNRTGETSAWDMDALAKELDALSDSKESGELEELSLDDLGFGADDLEELQEESQRKAKKSGPVAEEKTSQSVEGTNHQIVLKCNGRRHQGHLLKAFEDLDPQALIKHLKGIEVRAQSL